MLTLIGLIGWTWFEWKLSTLVVLIAIQQFIDISVVISNERS